MRHLFRVAAGLDSLILGEPQILGQVRGAHVEARLSSALGPHLDRLFAHAIRAGRRARAETPIGRNPASVSMAAVDLARKRLGRLADRRVLVVAAGEAGKGTARAFLGSGVSDVAIVNRTYRRAEELARQISARAVPFGDLAEAIGDADIVVTATSAEGYVVTREVLGGAMAHRGDSPLLIIDIAVPRDVDPRVREIPGVLLHDIDDLREVTEASLKGRGEAVAAVEAILDEEVHKALASWRQMDVARTIGRLHRQASAVRRREVEKLLRRLPGLSPEEAGHLEAMSRALVKKLLHQPIAFLKEAPEAGDRQALARRLFSLDG